jgi:hypothetical protein
MSWVFLDRGKEAFYLRNKKADILTAYLVGMSCSKLAPKLLFPGKMVVNIIHSIGEGV